MTIKVLIVDDKPIFAKRLNKVITNFKSIFSDVQYSTEVFENVDAFENAKKYILKNQSMIDLMLVDYNLDHDCKGTVLFTLIDITKYNIYKILHSVTTETRDIVENEIGYLQDDFCSSKDDTKIEDKLKKFEKYILQQKLFGNNFFYKKYYINNIDGTFRLYPGLEKKEYKNILYKDIIYAEIVGKDKTDIYYRDEQTNTIKSLKDIKKVLPIKKFIDSELFFRRVNGSKIINLLWVSKIDPVNNIIRFITLDNTNYEIQYIPTECFFSEIFPLLNDINSMPDFFKK